MGPKIEVLKSTSSKCALVIGLFASKTKEGKASIEFKGTSEGEIPGLLKKLSETKHFEAKKGETSFLRFVSTLEFPNTLLIGLGKFNEWTPEVARQVGANLFSVQKREKLPWMAISLDSMLGEKGGETLQALCEGYWLGSYQFLELKKPEKTAFNPDGLHLILSKGAQAESAVKRAKILSDAVNFARFLGDRPGNLMTPSELAKQAEKMAKSTGLKCTVWGRNQIEKEKMGLLLGVARGSREEPRFIQIEYQGGKKGEKPVILVGKGITFDSGGISIKPAARMEDMKYDMMGSATVLGAMQAIGHLAPKVNVIGLVAAAENMPGGDAQKPGDVAVSSSGKTVEIINTDAEGRLVLADALEFAQSKDPQAIIDFATLTGAVLDALGTVSSGIMGNHQGLIELIKSASDATGERVWQLPLYDEYLEDLKSNVADIKNSGVREAGSSKGGIFLKFFVDEKYPWAHCDIAGTAYHRKDVSYHPPKNGSGVLVRLVTHLIENWKPLPTSSH